MFRVTRAVAAGLAIAAAAFTQPALAEEAGAPRVEIDLAVFEVDASVTGVSDYRYRGVTLSDFKPAIQPSLTITHRSGIFVNLWGSNLSDNGGADLETDVSLGWSHEYGNSGVDVRAMYYAYPGASSDNYVEFSGTLSQKFGSASLALNASYAPSQTNLGNQDNLYLGVAGALPIKHTPVTLNASFGYEDGAFGSDKFDWLVGASVDVGHGYSLGSSYVDTSGTGGLREARAGGLVSLGKEF